MDKINYKKVKLNELFDSKRGNNKYTRKYCNANKGEYEVYTGTTIGSFGFIDTYEYNERALTYITDGKNTVDNRNWFMAENNIKKAIGLFQNHGTSEKAVNAQKRLIEIQKDKLTHMPMHEFKYDISDFYKQFIAEYEDHNIHELIWDVIFAFGFQSKQKIRDDVTKNSSQISSLFPIQLLGSEGQTEFLLPGLKLDDEDNIILHMYYKAREYERIQGDTVGR